MYERAKVIGANRKTFRSYRIERVSPYYIVTISYTMMVRMVIAMGVRRREIISLLRESVDVEERRIKVKSTGL